MPRQFVKIDRVAPFPEAIKERADGWTIRDAAPRQAECDIEERVLSVTMTPDIAGHNARAVEIARIKWSVPDITTVIPTAPELIVRACESARLHLLLGRCNVDLSAGTTRESILPNLVIAAADAGQRHVCVCHAIEAIGTGEDPLVIRRVRARVRNWNPIGLRNREVAWRCRDAAHASLSSDPHLGSFDATRRAVVAVMRTLLECAEEEKRAAPPPRGKPDPSGNPGSKGDGERKEKTDSDPSESKDSGDASGDAGTRPEGSEAPEDERDGSDEKSPEASADVSSVDPDGSPEIGGETSPEDGPEGDASGGMDADRDAEDGSTGAGGDDARGAEDASGRPENGPEDGKGREDGKTDTDGSEPGSPGSGASDPDRDGETDGETEDLSDDERADLDRDGAISDTALDRLNESLRNAENERRRRERARVDKMARDDHETEGLYRRERIARNRLERNLEVDLAAKRAVAMQLRREAAEGRKEAGIRATAEWDVRRRGWGKKFDRHEALVETGLETMQQKLAWLARASYGDDRNPGWGTVTLVKPPLTKHIRRNSAPSRRFTETGYALTQIHRYATDGKMFRTASGGDRGGGVLIDASGSMSLQPEEIELMCVAAPAVNVAHYCGHGERGVLTVIADGDRVADDSGMRSGFYGNIVDGPALREWLAKMPHPRIWVSDGDVRGNNDRAHAALTEDCMRICRANGIVRVATVEDALKLFCQIDPASERAAKRALANMKDRGLRVTARI